MIRFPVSTVVIAAALLSAPLTASADVHLQINMHLVENPTLDAANPQIVKASHSASVYGVMVNVDPTAKISTKKFTIGGMHLDDASDPLSKISEADCAKYILTIHVWKAIGAQKQDVFT